MKKSRPIEIVGGGLAGLALGLALRRRDVPVTVFEAGNYPRHRVCGEFISGLDPATRSQLGLDAVLADAVPHTEVAWFQRDRLRCHQRLPVPAWAISRHVLDTRLAESFEAAGGRLRTGMRVDATLDLPGRIDAAGRRRAVSSWLGLKLHVRGLTLDRGLELHLGRGGYVGLCALPGGEVNVCGLFRRRRSHLPAPASLPAYLAAGGLDRLAARLAAAEVCPGSAAAVAGLGFGRAGSGPGLRLGDAQCLLPPFFGNGMAAAFQMAAEIAVPLENWSRYGGDWFALVSMLRRRLAQRFRRREILGAALHPFLWSPLAQQGFGWLAGARCLPFGLIYRGLH